MEYKLNKIDTDLRQRVNDAVKEGRVHSTKNIAVNKDKKEEKKEKKNYNFKSYSKDKKIVVNAVKSENIEVDAFKEDVKENDSFRGSYIDVKK